LHYNGRQVGSCRPVSALLLGPVGRAIRAGMLIAAILPDCRPTLNCRALIDGGRVMLLRYSGFELLRGDFVIMAGSVALVVLTIFAL